MRIRIRRSSVVLNKMAAAVARGCCLCQTCKRIQSFSANNHLDNSYLLFQRLSISSVRKFSIQTQPEGRQKPRKKRDRLTVLKALSSTVKKIPNQPDYRFFDDIILNPRSLIKKKEWSIAIESGTKAAEYVLEQYPELFPLRKPVPGWPEEMVFSDDIEPTVENLQALIESNGKIATVVNVYEKLKSTESLSLEVKNQMLDFVSFHAVPASREEMSQPLSETAEGSSSSSSSSSEESSSSDEENNTTKNDNKSTWRQDGYADKLFMELKDVGNARTYEVFILGLLHHGEFIRSYHVFNEFKEKNFTGCLFLYNSLITHAINVRETDNDRWDLVKDVVDAMKECGVKPDVLTYNALLSVAVEREVNGAKFCQKIFGEMKMANIAPSLGTLYYILAAERKKDGYQDIQVALKMVAELKSDRVIFDLIHPADIQFFHTAMDSARFKRNGDMARELLDIVLNNGLRHMIGQKNSAFFGNYLCAISRNETDMNYVLQQYERIVPSVITPRDWVYQQLFFAARNNKNPSFVPKLYSDIVSLRVPMNERVATALFSALEKNIPEDRVAEYLHVVKDCEKWMGIFKIPMTSEMLSTSIKIHCSNMLADEAFKLAQKYVERNATPSYKSLLMILELNIKEENKSAALDALRFMGDMKLQYDDALHNIITETTMLSEKKDKIKSWFEVRAKS